jgi:hypothetical protein
MMPVAPVVVPMTKLSLPVLILTINELALILIKLKASLPL